MEPHYCQYSQCGKEIPPHLVKKYASRKYCDRTCRVLGVAEARKTNGFYARFARAGIAKQREMQAENGGVRPGHEKRSQAMAEHNRLVPRRHSSGWHKNRTQKS